MFFIDLVYVERHLDQPREFQFFAFNFASLSLFYSLHLRDVLFGERPLEDTL